MKNKNIIYTCRTLVILLALLYLGVAGATTSSSQNLSIRDLRGKLDKVRQIRSQLEKDSAVLEEQNDQLKNKKKIKMSALNDLRNSCPSQSQSQSGAGESIQ